MFSLKAQHKGLRLSFEYAPDILRYVCTDEVKLRQVLINLLSNAMKFTEEGGVSLRVCELNELNELSASKTQKLKNSKTHKTLHFEIEDTGSGIAPEEVDRLFEAFAQTETGKHMHEGTGLGLAISRKFVQLMGGNIMVKSDIGHSTTFTFNIHVEVVEETAIESKLPIRQLLALEPDQSRYRLLIVDDKQDNRQVLIKMLKPFGFELREAENGQEAIDIWQEWEPHLIWMDLRMPVMDGYEATKEIRRAEEQKLRKAEVEKSRRAEEQKTVSSDQHPASSIQHRTVIIAVTASSFEQEQAVILSAGCDDFLRKPFREHEIFDLLHKHLGIRFVYEEGEGQKVKGEEQKVEEVLTPEAFAALPDELCAGLQHAVEVIDMERANSLIDRIREHNRPLAEALTELVNNYRIDVLQALFQGK
jgi:CheY-like chemotaxis protein